MAQPDKEEQAVADGTSKTAEEEKPVYHVDRLIAESGPFLGQPGHVAAGAFSGQTKKNFTLDEAKKIVGDWLKRPAETDEREVA